MRFSSPMVALPRGGCCKIKGFNKEDLKRELILLFHERENFNISLNGENLDSIEEILPELIKDLYHYRIEGNISDDGKIKAQVTIKYDNLIVGQIDYNNKDF